MGCGYRPELRFERDLAAYGAGILFENVKVGFFS